MHRFSFVGLSIELGFRGGVLRLKMPFCRVGLHADGRVGRWGICFGFKEGGRGGGEKEEGRRLYQCVPIHLSVQSILEKSKVNGTVKRRKNIHVYYSKRIRYGCRWIDWDG
jgi:hypothetical protein